MNLVVGLGNPGSRYAFTRHNAGWHVIDVLCGRFPASRRTRSSEGILCGPCRVNGSDIFILKPLTFMNLSGIAVRSAVSKLGLGLEDILVIYDDVALPFGKIRFRARGSAAGHKGMLSIIGHLGSAEFSRIRIGIGGKAPEDDLSDYVTNPFTAEELEALPSICENAVDSVLLWVTQGPEVAMRETNAPPAEKRGR